MFKLMAMCAVLLTAGSVSAQSTPAEITFESCSACHGAAGSEIPAIAGQDYERLIDVLTAYAADADQATIMHRFAVAFSVSEIEGLARYISDLEGMPQ